MGAGHSFTDCACTDGLMVDLSGMQRVLVGRSRDGAGDGRGRHQAARARRRSSPSTAWRSRTRATSTSQALAGALATATHGTGARFPNLSARVVGMRLVTASGEAVDLSAESDPEAFLAARGVAGRAGGRVHRDRPQCVPLYTLHRHDEPMPLDDTLDRLDEHVDGNDHFEFFLFPYTRIASTRTTRAQRRRPQAHGRAGGARWIERPHREPRCSTLICRTGRRFRRLGPAPEPADRRRDVREPGRGPRLPRLRDRAQVRFTEMEYAIPREHAREALERALDLVERRRLPILFPFEVRFAAADDAFLSTAHGRETCYIAAHQYTGMEFESYFRGFEEIMDALRRAPALGQAPLPDRRDSARALPGLGSLPGRARPAGPRRRVHQRLHAARVPAAPVGGLMLDPGGAPRALRACLRRLDPPFAFVDLDAMWANSEGMLARAARQADPRGVQVASAAGRCCARSSTRDDGYRGLLTFTLPETLWLAGDGFEDLVVAYPTTDRGALRELAALTARSPDRARSSWSTRSSTST